MKRLLFVVASILVLIISVAQARPLLPVDELTTTDKVWLARAMVAEAGWLSSQDHVAIAYVLVRRWKAAQQRWPTLRFRDMVFSYAKGLGGGCRSYTPRQLWIRELGLDLGQPEHWPVNQARWDYHRKWWVATLERVDAWSRGQLGDPCRGLAWHWGAHFDLPKGKMVPVDCGKTKNTFYGVNRVINN